MKVAFRKNDRGRLFSRLISWWTRSPYSHCEAIVGEWGHDRYLCASASWVDGGVRTKTIKLTPDKWDIVETDADQGAAYRWFLRNRGKGYDFLGVLGFLWRPMNTGANRYFCSEAVAESMGFYEAWRYDPATLYSALVNRSMNR